MAGKKLTGRSAVLFGILFSGFASIFLVVGGSMAGYQDYILRTWQATPAVIDSGAIVSARGSKGSTHYHAEIVFHYTVHDQRYEAKTPLPLTVSGGSRAEAEAVLTRCPTGMETTAYVNPQNPSEAFLLREPLFFPYIFILGPMIHFTVGLGIALHAFADNKQKKAKAMSRVAMVWWVVGIMALGHWLSVGGSMTALFPLIAFSVYGAVAVVLVLLAVRSSTRAAGQTRDELFRDELSNKT